MSNPGKGRSPLFWFVVIAIVGVVGVFGYYSYRGYKAMQRRKEMMKDKLPTFTEPDTKYPKAPNTRAFGLHLGFTTLEQGQAFTSRLGLTCKDTSIRALMKEMRMKKLAELKKKGADAVSGASILKYRSKKERNPQIRWSCEKTPAKTLKDRTRVDIAGRLLLVFDSAKHPLRHVSFSYNAYHPKGVNDYIAAQNYYTKLFGKPLKSSGKLPVLTASLPIKSILFRKYQSVRHTWRFSDLRVHLRMMSLGKYVTFAEEVEVPWPVRADAPAR